MNNKISVCRRGVALLFVAVMPFLLTYCEMDASASEDVDASLLAPLLGTWAGLSPDSYTINRTTVTYNDGGWGYGYDGKIQHIARFTDTTGVILVEYKHPPENPAANVQGNFLGVFYMLIDTDKIDLANASDLQALTGSGNVAGVEASNLSDAKKKFTKDRVADFVNWAVIDPFYRQNP